jgi:transcriptional antiterminator NusG
MDINENEEKVLGEDRPSSPEPNEIEMSQESVSDEESLFPVDIPSETHQEEAPEEALEEGLLEEEQDEEEPASEVEPDVEEVIEEEAPLDADAEAELEEDLPEVVSEEIEELPVLKEEETLDEVGTELEVESEQLTEEEPDDSPEEAAGNLVEVEAEGELEEEGDLIAERKPSAIPEKDDGRAWYVVHCYSGNEDKVRFNILQRIESMGMDDLIFDVVVPTEDEVNIKIGERQIIEKKVFPGYILVNMILTEESWYMVRNTPGVTGFVGMGNDPTPLQTEEVARILKRMESESPRINVTFRPGERVRIVDGPFEDFYGKVSEIDMERATVRVMVNFFGRETPVELDFLQVEEA